MSNAIVLSGFLIPRNNQSVLCTKGPNPIFVHIINPTSCVLLPPPPDPYHAMYAHAQATEAHHHLIHNITQSLHNFLVKNADGAISHPHISRPSIRFVYDNTTTATFSLLNSTLPPNIELTLSNQHNQWKGVLSTYFPPHELNSLITEMRNVFLHSYAVKPNIPSSHILHSTTRTTAIASSRSNDVLFPIKEIATSLQRYLSPQTAFTPDYRSNISNVTFTQGSDTNDTSLQTMCFTYNNTLTAKLFLNAHNILLLHVSNNGKKWVGQLEGYVNNEQNNDIESRFRRTLATKLIFSSQTHFPPNSPYHTSKWASKVSGTSSDKESVVR